jgi:hypothetical protein
MLLLISAGSHAHSRTLNHADFGLKYADEQSFCTCASDLRTTLKYNIEKKYACERMTCYLPGIVVAPSRNRSL